VLVVSTVLVGTARASVTRLWVYCGVPVFGSLLEVVFSILVMVPSLRKKKQGIKDIKETSPSPSLKRHGRGSTQGNQSKVSSKGGARKAKAKRPAKNSVDEVSEGSDGTSAKRRLRRSPHVARGSPHVAKAKQQPDSVRKRKKNDSADEDSYISMESSEYSSESDCPSSNSSASSSSTNSVLQQSGIYVRYAQKIANALKGLDLKMKKLKYRSVERHITFNDMVKKCRKVIISERSSLRMRDGRERRSWEFMFHSWLAYAEEYPEQKNTICIKENRKLACWVHEQRKKFVKSVLLEDRLVLLLDNGFIFQPRLHEKESMKTLVDRHKGMYCSTFVCL